MFPRAELLALDASADMLARVRVKADERHLGARVRTVQADLDEGWPAIDSVDLVWASLSVHHLADPARVLSDARAALAPGGLLAMVEMDDQLRFLPDDIGLGRSGLEGRINAVLAELHSQQVPSVGLDWCALLGQAGFTVAAVQAFPIDLRAPVPPAAGPNPHAWLPPVPPRRARVRPRPGPVPGRARPGRGPRGPPPGVRV